MRDKTWGERLEDAVDTAANAVGLLSLIAVVLTAVWGVTYCWVNHITVSDIGQKIKSFVDDGQGDEVGFVKAMRRGLHRVRQRRVRCGAQDLRSPAQRRLDSDRCRQLDGVGSDGDIVKTCGWGCFRQPPFRLIRRSRRV